MQLAELLKDWPCSVTGGSIRTNITGIEDYAQAVKPGDIFIVRKGKKTSGSRFVKEALARGAAAIVSEESISLPITDQNIPFVWVPNTSLFLSYASAKLSAFPAEALTVIAVTGTNGKTTVSHFVSQLLRALHKNVAVIGTVGFFINEQKQQTVHEQLTTLQAKELHPILKQCVRNGVTHVVLEASSMGLQQHRLDHCDIDCGVFLNLTEDHLEDHGGLEAYKRAKKRLADLSKKLVLNGDDNFCRSVGIYDKKKSCSFGFDNHNDLHIQIVSESLGKTVLCLQTSSSEHIAEIPFTGKYHVQNAVAALMTLWRLGYSIEDLAEHMWLLRLPEGRLEKIDNPFGVDVYVDYAHTAEALQAVLQTLDCSKNLYLVFSCGGNRDKAKRFAMGAVASKYADVIFLTTDNPRDEDPILINESIIAGFTEQQYYEIYLDRKVAIHQALAKAEKGDTVLVAGKGHEQTQQIKNQKFPFSDQQCIRDYFLNLMTKDGVE
ncbi:UDP-N-acetylmuramoyl-L-alanyl-D-glutamate--2,6-diaminopimelate ligase [Lysinibacillus xylanilyticus]|uniref:UDP-N-acetylmuramoyl-L-alanyl-D-glutamate--2, 6-diaminopimelate ligase n=1 Tax=Lysinibacillus xylanilyticus TaxID=582475 RepID=UPI002B23FFD4|nr:UDP-N-acetylmuramoyl-L-alanyl-D-glutamate--2,6-diaminopimelate ligase [Lysinibacillus xylanilyticus]MEB2298255.1 UDP-N-acetylmuramoyl-L-alanyl-D-glutamate--2,6-diaminopimelate ligase [Lysinibacillus xylanilyticus]